MKVICPRSAVVQGRLWRRTRRIHALSAGLAAFLVPLFASSAAAARDQLCDTRYQDCRAPLITLINNEPAGGGIDVAFWFMNDDRYRTALQNAFNRGVRVRVLLDPRADPTKAGNAQVRANLAAAGIPIRKKVKVESWGDILHWKMMHFEKGPNGKSVVSFSAANFSAESYVPLVAYKDYIDEVVYITDDPRITGTFAMRFENYWTDTTGSFQDEANVAPPYPRYYPVVTQDPALNFPPTQNYETKAISRYDKEPAGGKIDVIMYRISDADHADGMLRAISRGIPVRLITEEENYRDTRYIWHSYNVDRMWAGGVDVKQRYLTGGKAGITHQKSVILYDQQIVIFGSSNWSSASATQQLEHNLFSAPCAPGQATWCDGARPNNTPQLPEHWFFNFFVKQFNDKWDSVNPYNFTEFLPFKPKPGGTPLNKAPANGAVNVGTSGVVLKWDGGVWNHKYDVYLGTTQTFTAADKIRSNIECKPFGTECVGNAYTGNKTEVCSSPECIERWTIPANILQPGTTYFWRVVGKTMADSPLSAAKGLNLAKSGPAWSFTTAGTGGSTVSTPYGGTPVSLPGTIQAENFDSGGPNVAYRDTTPGNSGGKYRSTDVDIASTTDTGGGYNIGYTVKSEFLKYTVNVVTAGTYTLRLRYANGGTGAKVRVSVNGTNVTFALQDTGGWQVWRDLSTTIPLSAGTQVLTLWFDERNVQNTAAGNINYLSIQ